MKPALLLVDLQGDFLAAPELLPDAETLVARAAALLRECRRRKIPVIHIWTTIRGENDLRLPHWKKNNRRLCVAGTDGHKTPDALQPLPGEIVIHKTGFNPFAGGELDAAIQKLNCNSVILAGLHLHACIRTAATECLERGHEIRIAEDAAGSYDPIHSASTRRWLAERCVAFEFSSEIFARLDGFPPRALIHRSPRITSEVLFEIPISNANEIAAAASAARNFQLDWHRTSIVGRQKILEEVARRLEASAPEFARQMALEIGKPISHGLEEVRRAADNVRDVIRRASAAPLQKKETAGVVRYQPVGAIALISPWNNPVAIPVGKIAPALIYGNTVVWKPAPAANHISQRILKLFRESGVPENAVCILEGDAATARHLASDENINAVTFTGAAAGGFAIQEICARRCVPLQAELSGNNAAIVWDDADFATAATQIAWGAFAFAGQRCTANRRAIVPASHLEKFLSEIEIAAEKLIWSDPLNSETDIGPVISEFKRDEMAALVARAEAEGTHRILFPKKVQAREPWVKTGAYAQPVIACCDRPNHVLVREETMSPLLIVQPAEDFERALELCNGVRHGLIAALFSDSPDLRKKFLENAEAGVLKINACTAGVDASLPFGGWKSSGIGPPEHGEADRLFYTRTQSVYGT
ncbi:MAG TPA: aldehyde dehydrogenase family protein [Verrucomicrobiae bacterium]|nr:aldehyde dehydrogenase family protein [Verrucomicrobiae bacterium]